MTVDLFWDSLIADNTTSTFSAMAKAHRNDQVLNQGTQKWLGNLFPKKNRQQQVHMTLMVNLFQKIFLADDRKGWPLCPCI